MGNAFNDQELGPKIIEVLKGVEVYAKAGNLQGVRELLETVSHRLDTSPHPKDPLSMRIRHWVDLQDGSFHLTDTYKDLQIVTPNDKNNSHIVFHRMVKEGVIEKDGKRSGTYRKVDKDVDIIDWKNAPTDCVDITLPLGLSEWVNVYPGNLIVCAGTQDSGKTALALNFIRLNMDKFIFNYYSSEMGSTELNVRLSKFDDIVTDGWRFNAFEKSSNFEDVIKPDEITIIDYLEVTDEFYKVASTLTRIKERLKNGIAFICLQKNRGVDAGRGGSFSLEKPRLYLSLDPGQAKIVKAKNWKSSLNPNGRVINYKIVNGCKFLTDGGWHEPPEEDKPKYKKVYS